MQHYNSLFNNVQIEKTSTKGRILKCTTEKDLYTPGTLLFEEQPLFWNKDHTYTNIDGKYQLDVFIDYTETKDLRINKELYTDEIDTIVKKYICDDNIKSYRSIFEDHTNMVNTLLYAIWDSLCKKYNIENKFLETCYKDEYDPFFLLQEKIAFAEGIHIDFLNVYLIGMVFGLSKKILYLLYKTLFFVVNQKKDSKETKSKKRKKSKNPKQKHRNIPASNVKLHYKKLILDMGLNGSCYKYEFTKRVRRMLMYFVLPEYIRTVFTNDEFLLLIDIIYSHSHILYRNTYYTTQWSLYPLCSMIEHSCKPNCAMIQTKNGNIQVRAITFIKKGESLSLDYQPEFAFMSSQTRINLLFESYGFICKCIICSGTKDALYADYKRAFWCPSCKKAPVNPYFQYKRKDGCFFLKRDQNDPIGNISRGSINYMKQISCLRCLQCKYICTDEEVDMLQDIEQKINISIDSYSDIRKQKIIHPSHCILSSFIINVITHPDLYSLIQKYDKLLEYLQEDIFDCQKRVFELFDPNKLIIIEKLSSACVLYGDIEALYRNYTLSCLILKVSHGGDHQLTQLTKENTNNLCKNALVFKDNVDIKKLHNEAFEILFKDEIDEYPFLNLE